MFETIEHLMNDQKLIDDLADRLNPGGTLLLTAPYKEHKPLWGEKLSEAEDGGHVRWGYSHDDVRAIFERSGLEVVADGVHQRPRLAEAREPPVRSDPDSLTRGLGRDAPAPGLAPARRPLDPGDRVPAPERRGRRPEAGVKRTDD